MIELVGRCLDLDLDLDTVHLREHGERLQVNTREPFWIILTFLMLVSTPTV